MSPLTCDHREYAKEQNIGLHDVIHPAAMARVTATGIVRRGQHSHQGKSRHCLLPILQLHRLSPSCLEQPCPDAPSGPSWCADGWAATLFTCQAIHMIEHSAKVHNMVRAKPAREKGGGVRSGIPDHFQTSSPGFPGRVLPPSCASEDSKTQPEFWVSIPAIEK